MAKQIHELPLSASPAADDRIVVSGAADQVTRHARLSSMPVRGAGGVERRLAERLGDTVSVRDFGAVGDGVADDAPAFEAALATPGSVYVPAGRYRLSRAVTALPRTRIFGAGRDVTFVQADGDAAFVFERNRDAFEIDPTSAKDWSRSALENMTVVMARGGVRVYGHEFRAVDLNFFGGEAPDGQADEWGWCLDLIDANECLVWGVSGGYGGGVTHKLAANGVRWRASVPGVNYGDSLVGEASFKLQGENTAGFLLDGSTADSSKVINNMVLQRLQVNAPVGGNGITPLAGTVGIKLRNAARVCLIDCDVEVLDVAFEEYSESAGGVAGACVANTYIGCIAHYSNTNYKDSNNTFTRSVLQRNFFGCDNVAPLPTGNFAGDGGRCQDGDAFLTGAWLFNAFGEPSVQMRSRDKSVLLLTSDYKGTEQADADGHPRTDKPYTGVLVEMASKQSAKLTRAVSLDDDDPDDPSAKLLDVRLELGNGEGDARGELARVQVNDPLMLRGRETEPPRPRDGLIHFAAGPGALPATGDWYMGQGVYCRINSGEYAPMAVQRGAVPERERNGDFTVSALDFGKIIRVNHGATKTVTIPAGLVEPGTGGRKLWIIRQGSGGVKFAAGEGVTLRVPNEADLAIRRQYQMVEVLITSTDDVYLNHLFPDAIEPFERKLKWTAGNVQASATYRGRLVQVSRNDTAYVEIPQGLVPEGMEAISLRVVKAAAGDVEIRAGSGMSLIAPGGADPYVITQAGKTVELIVTSPIGDGQNQRPNTVYVVD